MCACDTHDPGAWVCGHIHLPGHTFVHPRCGLAELVPCFRKSPHPIPSHCWLQCGAWGARVGGREARQGWGDIWQKWWRGTGLFQGNYVIPRLVAFQDPCVHRPRHMAHVFRLACIWNTALRLKGNLAWMSQGSGERGWIMNHKGTWWLEQVSGGSVWGGAVFWLDAVGCQSPSVRVDTYTTVCSKTSFSGYPGLSWSSQETWI
jgi:hypothetical protein